MSSATTRSGFDTWIGSAKPTSNHYKEKYLALRSSGGAAKALVYFKVPAPRGSTILSATLRVWIRGAAPASTMTAQRITNNWTVSKTTWAKPPSVTSTDAATKAVPAKSSGQAVDLDVTDMVQTIVNGAPGYGFMLSTNSSTLHYLYGMDSGGSYKPVLTVEWSDAPAAPTTLNPSDGTVSTTLPTLQFDYTDVSGNTSLSAVHVQIDPEADGTTPDFDSGAVAATAPELNLASTVFAGLVADTPTFWRVRVQDGAGIWSDWSDWTSMQYVPKVDPVIENLDAGVVYDVSPTVIWSHPSQTAYQVLVYGPDGAALHDSGKRTGTDDVYTIPAGVLTDGLQYLVEVRVWDAVTTRAATPGDPTYSLDQALVTVEVDPTVDGVATLSADVPADTPFVDLEWTRSTTPDSWTLVEDGVPVMAAIEPADVFVSGSTYRMRYYGARPDFEHVYSVRAVVNGAQSPDGPTATATTSPAGLWLIDPDDGLHVTLWGDEEGTWNMTDDASVYTPINSTEVVRIVSGMRGLEGSLSGYLMDGFGKTFTEAEEALYALKARAVARLRLVASDENIEVLAGNVRVAPRPITRQGRVSKSVSFDFWQVGDLPFDPQF